MSLLNPCTGTFKSYMKTVAACKRELLELGFFYKNSFVKKARKESAEIDYVTVARIAFLMIFERVERYITLDSRNTLICGKQISHT